MTSPSPQVPVSTVNSLFDRFAKIKLRDALLAVVYDTWERKLAARMDQIMDNNYMLNPSQDAFCLRLRGVCYWHTTAFGQGADYYPSNKLHPSLKEIAHAWVEDNTEITTEKRMVSHSLSAILAASNRIEDYLLLLPDSLHELTKSYQAMLPDPALHKLAPPSVIQQLQFIHRPYLALMGQRYVMSLIL